MTSIKHRPDNLQGERPRKRLRQRSSLVNLKPRSHGLRSTSRRKTAAGKQNHRGKQDVSPYYELERPKNEIRILSLQPGQGVDEIHCTLGTYQLDDCPDFEALSYTWGDRTQVEPIFVNGSRLMVTHNLHAALRHLRHIDSCRVLWIDTVCINQADLDERSHQVFLMNRVYSAAKQVLVWLGEARGSSDIAMKRLKQLAAGQQLARTEEGLSRLRDLIYDSLIDRDWWGRLWIVQEVVLAKSDPIMICGSSCLPWEIFMSGCQAGDLGKIYESDDQHRRRRVVQSLWLFSLRQEYRCRMDPLNSTEAAIDLGSLLLYTQDFQVTDPHDKVYGCLGLASMEEREAIRPDYQKPTQLVYLEITKYLLERSPQIFYSVFSASKSGGMLHKALPSWVPDYAALETMSPSNPGLGLGSKTLLVHGQRDVSFKGDNRALSIAGSPFDTIDIAVELKGNKDLLILQLPELERLAQQGVEKILPKGINPCFQKLKKSEGIIQAVTGRSDEDMVIFREHYDDLSGGAESSPQLQETASSIAHVISRRLSGRYFFITSMGFCGVAMERVRKNDSVTILFGELFPIILRPRGVSYSMVCAAYVSGIMDGELTGDMYKNGVVKKRTFIIR
ncbi:heterokaryon incompatibility protein-domain-containing protein [Bisporella sp. PMI_857]|nr:heterokaryon incompatibility protein-domain-containing protein [Bisporella sp. PMI_857]